MSLPNRPVFTARPWKGLFLTIFFFTQIGGAWAQPDAAIERVGTPWTGERGIHESTAQIMAREKTSTSASSAQHEIRHPRFEGDFQFLPQNPESPNVSTWPSTNAPLNEPTGGDPQTLGIGFTGATLNDTQAFPPDSMGAIGPAQYCVAVNGRIRTFNKITGAADGVIDADTDVFFQPAMTPPASDNFTSDPRIRYDRLSGKWIIIMIDVPGRSGALPNRVMIAVSDSAVLTANTIWNFFYFQQDLVSPAGDTGEFADYPTLGIDANALYIGVNLFGTRGQGSFSNTTGFVVRKSSILGNGPIVVTAFRGLIGHGQSSGPYTPQGVDNFDPAATEGYFIGVDSAYYGRLDLRRITNPGGTPAISANIQFTVPTTGGTITVPHLGNTGGANGNLDGLDYRLMAAHIRNGRLWTSANIAVDNTGSPSGTDTRNGIRWYELQGIVTGQTPSVYQSGTLFQPSASNTTDQRHYWMGSIMVSGQGHAAMGFSVAGANERINAGTAGRLANDPLGTMQTPLLYTSTSSSYNPSSDPGGATGRRWGDYSYTSLDPSDDMTFWTIQEFCNAENSYGVRVVKLLAPPPATPANSNPASLAQGVSNTNLFITGLITNGSGFFDPGAGFSNRISASVSGSGVTVQNISYTNPSNIVLTVSVSAGATPGSRTVTVTNPDGQSSTSGSAILTIVASTVTNHAPVLSAISDQTINELTNFFFSASASDSDGDSLTFSLEPGAPTGANINSTNGVFTWNPTEAQGPSTNDVTIRVADNGSPSLSATQSFRIFVSEINSAPSLVQPTNQVVTAGAVLSFAFSASDSDIPANLLSYNLEPGAPTGTSVNSTNGIFTWAPDETQLGAHSVSVRVTDDGLPNLSDTKTFSITVVSPPILSIAQSETNFVISWTAVAGQTYRVQFADTIDGAWTDLAGDVTADAEVASKVDLLPAASERYYRVLLLP